jgi:phage major head subunit gpT-like protein
MKLYHMRGACSLVVLLWAAQKAVDLAGLDNRAALAARRRRGSNYGFFVIAGQCRRRLPFSSLRHSSTAITAALLDCNEQRDIRNRHPAALGRASARLTENHHDHASRLHETIACPVQEAGRI